jgi:hypothetical protein
MANTNNTTTTTMNSSPAQPAAPASSTQEHLFPMISLRNISTPKELRDFDKSVKKLLGLPRDLRVRYLMELKFDGMAISLIFRRGRLVRALTRGDGPCKHIAQSVQRHSSYITLLPRPDRRGRQRGSPARCRQSAAARAARRSLPTRCCAPRDLCEYLGH